MRRRRRVDGGSTGLQRVALADEQAARAGGLNTTGGRVLGSPVLEAINLTTGYGAVPVIRGLNLQVRAGEVVALLGPNGAGKSTTLLALAGELPLMGGSVRIDGKETTAPLYRRARAGLAFVPEERCVFRTLSCADNLRVGRAEAAATLELFPDLDRRLGVGGGLLSGGEQQMLAVGRALSTRPRLLLADELSLGLAPMIVDRLLEALRTAADAGCAVLVVEQHVRKVMEIADTVHILRRGAVELSGTRDEMRGRIAEIEQQYLSGALAGKEP